MSNEIIIRPDEILSILGKGLVCFLFGLAAVLSVILLLLLILGFWVGIGGLVCVHERLTTQKGYTVGIKETILYLIWGAITYSSALMILGYFIIKELGL